MGKWQSEAIRACGTVESGADEDAQCGAFPGLLDMPTTTSTSASDSHSSGASVYCTALRSAKSYDC